MIDLNKKYTTANGLEVHSLNHFPENSPESRIIAFVRNKAGNIFSTRYSEIGESWVDPEYNLIPVPEKKVIDCIYYEVDGKGYLYGEENTNFLTFNSILNNPEYKNIKTFPLGIEV